MHKERRNNTVIIHVCMIMLVENPKNLQTKWIQLDQLGMVCRSCEMKKKCTEDTINLYLHAVGGQQRVLKQDLKSTNHKEVISKLNYESRNFCLLKGTTKREEATHTVGEGICNT